jgi:hypothetical protein
MKSLFLIIATFLLIGCGRSTLPSERDLLALGEAGVRTLVLTHVPLGTERTKVEGILQDDFQKEWKVVTYESLNMMSTKGFSVAVLEDDSYIRSNFATADTSLVSGDVLTMFFLFDGQNRLKDVSVSRWHDAL